MGGTGMIDDINLNTLREWLPALRTQYQIRGDAIVPRKSADAPTVEQMGLIRAAHYSIIPMVDRLIAFYEKRETIMTQQPNEYLLPLIDAIRKYGTVHRHSHYRPIRECIWAGFAYMLGVLLCLITVSVFCLLFIWILP
jgi:hypothetical protein